MKFITRYEIHKVVASHTEGCKVKSRQWMSCTDLYYARGAQGVLPMRVGGGVLLNLIYRL